MLSLRKFSDWSELPSAWNWYLCLQKCTEFVNFHINGLDEMFVIQFRSAIYVIDESLADTLWKEDSAGPAGDVESRTVT